MAGSMEWVLLAYRLPRQPSNPRVVVWRKLRRLGAVQLVDGLVALPRDARTQEQFEWLADEVLEAGGEATTWTARTTSARQERALAQRMTDAVAAEYQSVIDDASVGEHSAMPERTLARLRRELHRISQRDFFPPRERDVAYSAVDAFGMRLLAERAMP